MKGSFMSVSYTHLDVYKRQIKKFYYQEYLIGKVAIGMIEKELKVTLPQDEAAFIALHIVNAELDLDMTEMVLSLIHICKVFPFFL